MNAPVVRFRRLDGNTDLPIPAYATAGAAGFDLRAAVSAGAPTVIAPGERALVPTGFACAVPHGYEMQVRPRSGLATKHGIGIVNSPGTVDSDYRGPLMVCLINLGTEPFSINRGDRIAQAVIAPAPQLTLIETGELDDTTRGDRGFGSTGLS
jgi:dUTP pyrophosphatase